MMLTLSVREIDEEEGVWLLSVLERLIEDLDGWENNYSTL